MEKKTINHDGFFQRFGRYSTSAMLAIYIMFERRKPDQDKKFAEFLDVWPKSVRQFPFFFNDAELSYLKGSPFLKELEDIKDAHKEIYDRMCEEVPGFKNFKLKEFNETMVHVNCRT